MVIVVKLKEAQKVIALEMHIIVLNIENYVVILLLKNDTLILKYPKKEKDN